MAILKPFRALRPTPQRAAQVSAVPYDVVNTEEAAALAAGNPYSFLHVSRAEIDLPPGTDPYSELVYQKANENFLKLKQIAPLLTEGTDSLYVYRLRMGDHTQTGIAATWSVDEYDSDRIKKHERTRQDKEDDRTRHILTLRAQTGPVFLTFRDDVPIANLLAAAVKAEPLFDFTAPDSVQHTVWRITDTAPWVSAMARVPALYIADGHHRAASASRARASMQGQPEAVNYFLAVAFPAGQLRILPYNRVVKDVPEGFMERLRERLQVTPTNLPAPTAPGWVHMYFGGSWYALQLIGNMETFANPLDSLDVSLLQNRVLAPLLGIENPRIDKRIDFVCGIRGTRELEQRVDSGRDAVAFSMFPTGLDQLMAISDAGEIMPPKSTWFEPKLRDALLIHTF
ncbi:MAG: DUF1015 domain-containing protein [Candidatus Xenobia bacterium]